jgi:GntR family transcriptional regulator, N-acetylglucosamine utilization regulator
MTTLQRQNAVPLYLQIKRLLEREIANGTLAPHSRVPSERELSEQYGISRMTARQALAELIQEGRLYTSAGKGTFVAEPKISQSIQSLTSFSEDMRSRGLTPVTRVLRREIAPANTVVAGRLQIPKQAPVVCLERLRLGNEEPMAIEVAFLAFGGMERLMTLDLQGSLYALLREEFKIIPSTAIQECEAALARPHERALLHLQRGAPVLKIQRTTFDGDQRPFEYVQSIYRGDRYRFVARLVREGGH